MRKFRYLNYISYVMCGNCRYLGKLKIPIYTEITKVDCPRCGMGELHHPSYFGVKEIMSGNTKTCR